MESEKTIKAQCRICRGNMQFVEGDIIFGDTWYHKGCAEQIKLAPQATR